MHSTLRLLVSCGSGQNHITNKLNLTIAIVFLSVIFFFMTAYISYTHTSISQIFDVNLSLVLSNNVVDIQELVVKCQNYTQRSLLIKKLYRLINFSFIHMIHYLNNIFIKYARNGNLQRLRPIHNCISYFW